MGLLVTSFAAVLPDLAIFTLVFTMFLTSIAMVGGSSCGPDLLTCRWSGGEVGLSRPKVSKGPTQHQTHRLSTPLNGGRACINPLATMAQAANRQLPQTANCPCRY